jgi:hypothetical protein
MSNGAFYSLLIQAGYLVMVEKRSNVANVCIPNQEMRQIWSDFIFAALMPDEDQALIDLFAERDPAIFSEYLESLMTYTLSSWDVKPNLEYVYHMFLLGGLVFSTPALDKSKIKSNMETGDGRCDIWMERDGINYIFELKKCDAGDASDENIDTAKLEAKAAEALKQIDDKQYGAELDRCKPIWKVGVSFYKRQCRVKCAVVGALQAQNRNK